jgi:hypothetical protein
MPKQGQKASRKYITSVRSLLTKYKIARPDRDAPLTEVLSVHRKLLLKTHPDKGGTSEDIQRVYAAKEKLDADLKEECQEDAAPNASQSNTQQSQGTSVGGGRKRPTTKPPTARMKRPAAATTTTSASTQESTPCNEIVPLSMDLCHFCGENPHGSASEFRIHSTGVLLTYNGARLAEESVWPDFKEWIKEVIKECKVLYHCSTMELCRRRRPHLHLMLQFREKVDYSSKRFSFLDILPNARPTWMDYCQQSRGTKNVQKCLDRGFFYVFANKIGTCTDASGTLCVHGNYGPCWTDNKYRYEASGDWVETLWRRYQLVYNQAREYVVRCRDNVPARLRNLDEAFQREEELLDTAELQENRERIHSNPELYKPFKTFAVAQAWLRSLQIDSLRYAILLIGGQSRSGKTELAKSWFRNPCTMSVGDLVTVFPAKMRKYNRRFHDGIVLDDIRDLRFLVNFQHVFQGKPDQEVGFAEDTKGGSCAYSKLVFATPFVGTFNNDTKNLDLLEKDDFLCKPGNRIVLELTSAPFRDDTEAEAGDGRARPSSHDSMHALMPPMEEEMVSWKVADVARCLQEQDLWAAAKILRNNDVNGRDFVSLTSADLQAHFNMTAFLADKVIVAREACRH